MDGNNKIKYDNDSQRLYRLPQYQITFIRIAFWLYANVMIHQIEMRRLYMIRHDMISSICIKPNMYQIYHIL